MRGSHVESLSYYVSTDYLPGTIVTIPIRKKEVRGIVVGSKPLSNARTEVRSANFSLRKLPAQKFAFPLPETLIETARQLTQTTPTTIGAALYALLPPEVRTGDQLISSDLPCHGGYELPAISVLQAYTLERYQVYRSRIREAFAHRGSVVFVVPTSADIERAYQSLSHGIERKVVTFSPVFGTKKLSRAYELFHDLSQAKLIITTPRHAFLDRHDITTIIIEQSRSPYYRSRIRPYFDMREVIKTFARVTGRAVLIGDILPHTEDEYARREDLYLTEYEHPKRLEFQSAFKVLKQSDKPAADIPFQLFSKQLIDMIKSTIESRRNVFLFAARRGIAPVVACVDCGYIFRCPDSGAPYSLMRTKRNGEERRWFISPISGKRVRAMDTCSECGSWRLRERGIGIQQIYDEATKLFDVPVVLFDHTTATTHNKARLLMSTFYDAKGAILIGTSMVLPYIERPIEHTAIVSLDATRMIPTWRADEELLALILRLRECTTGSVWVQTRTEPDSLIEYATRGLVDQFYTDEIELRQALNYPPFSIFVHLSYEGKKEDIANLESLIAKTIEPAKIIFYNTAQTSESNQVRNGLIRVSQSEWPNPTLMDNLRTLPQSIRIEINPQRIV
ncbi:MAG: hypothetical protein WDZ68_01040 [Candidatus Paceibacterota bacterium]